MSDNGKQSEDKMNAKQNESFCACAEKTQTETTERQTERMTATCAEKRERLLRQAETECNRDKISEADLQEVYRNACVGKESVEILKSFSQNKGFRNLLIRQYKEYSSIAKEIELYANQLSYNLEKTSIFAKGMMYFTTAVNTLKDKSDSKLSEIMMQGINMGIISLTKLTNKLSEENRSCVLANNLLDLLDKNLEEMKLFL